MPDTPLNPDALSDTARVALINSARELGQEHWCLSVPAQAKRVLNECADALATAQPVVTATIENFINQRPEYITALKGTSGTDDQGDYWRWSGGAEARRQLATMLGWTVPHEPGETTRPEVK